MASVKDVAERASVSIGTASRALRNVGYISEEARGKVLKAAEELGYVANYSAQQIRSASAEKTVGIIISESANDYFFKVIAQLNAKLLPYHYRILVLYSSAEFEEEEKNFRYLISNRVSTILFIPASDQQSHVLSLAHKNNINVIQLFVKAYDNMNTVINDDEQGAALAADHLADKGCKKILLLDAPYKNFDPATVSPNRQAGLLHHGGIAEKKVVNFDPYAENAREALKNTLAAFRPDGVIAGIGKTGQILAALVHKREFSFPFVSFDDNSWFENYGITAIKQGTARLVDHICDMILHPKPSPRCVKVEEQLIIRET